jgi:hypothetical protein
MTKVPASRCGNCRFLRVAPDRSGRRVVRKANAYSCTFPLPEMPALPESLTRAHGFRPYTKQGRSSMTPDDGANCPTWEIFVAEGA